MKVSRKKDLIFRSKPVQLINTLINDFKFSDYLSRFQLVKFFIQLLIIGFLYSATKLAIDLELVKFNSFSTYIQFIINFWIPNKLLFISALIIFSLLYSDSFQGQYRNFIQFKSQPKRIDWYLDRKFKKANKILAIISFLFFILVAVPFMQLTKTQLITILMPIALGFLSILARLIVRRKKQKNTKKDSLGKFTFSKKSYNSAALGNYSNQVTNEIKIYEDLSASNPTNDNVVSYLSGSNIGTFNGFKNIYIQLEKLFDEDDNGLDLKNKISLHERTTDAFSHVISKLKNIHTNKLAIIYCDADYPSIIEVARQNIEEDKRFEIKVSEKLLNDNYSLSYLKSEIESKISIIPSSIEKIIILISHHYYISGAHNDITNIIDSLNLNTSKNKFIFVVDGAQSVGNIKIQPEIFKKTHFYLACGHKWLLSHRTLGILYINDQLILSSKSATDPKIFINKTRAFNTYNYDISTFSGTINVNPIISLSVALSDINTNKMSIIEEHNTTLANAFRDAMNNVVQIIQPFNYTQKGGLITIKYEKAEELNNFLLHRENDYSGFFINVKEPMIRFSFHYFMSIRDVNKLVYSILEYMHESKNY